MKIRRFTPNPNQNFSAKLPKKSRIREKLQVVVHHQDAVDAFKAGIGRIRLLSKDREKALGRQIQAGVTKIHIPLKWSMATNREFKRLHKEQKVIAKAIQNLPEDDQPFSKQLKALSDERVALAKQQRDLVERRIELTETDLDEIDELSSENQPILQFPQKPLQAEQDSSTDAAEFLKKEQALKQALDKLSQAEQNLSQKISQLSQKQRKLSEEILPKEKVEKSDSNAGRDSVISEADLEEVVAEEVESPSVKYVLTDEALKARNELVNANLRLVMEYVKKFANIDSLLPELIQEGNLALIKAAERYNPDLIIATQRDSQDTGFCFSTLACIFIRQLVLKHLNKYKSIISGISKVSELKWRLESTEAKFASKSGRMPEIEELAKELDVMPEKIQAVKSVNLEPPSSFDMPISPNGDRILADIFPDANAENPFEKAARWELIENVQGAVKRLPSREGYVITHNAGIGGVPERTLGDIAPEVPKKNKGGDTYTHQGISLIKQEGFKQLRQDERLSIHYQECMT